MADNSTTTIYSNYLKKMQHYCAYQERCHSQVRYKLLEIGARGLLVEQIISALINENYLNEQRFAEVYAGGKFRILDWGKVKIKQALMQKQVSTYCIQKALQSIDMDDYTSTINKLCEKKWNTLPKGNNKLARIQKLKNYLVQKGYESSVITQAVKPYYNL
jgi:regulatory protein